MPPYRRLATAVPFLAAWWMHDCHTLAALCRSGSTEAYLELEIYADTNRRIWPGATLNRHWEPHFPLGGKAFELVHCQNLVDRSHLLRKRADLHIKFAGTTNAEPAVSSMIEHLIHAGFYCLTTWASNRVCTAEFLHFSDAFRVFHLLERFFNRYGGPCEMTLESISEVYRTVLEEGPRCRLAAINPVVVDLNI